MARHSLDWEASKKSVEKLDALKQEFAVTGHGKPVSGSELQEELESLVTEFERIAVPNHGKFVIRRD